MDRDSIIRQAWATAGNNPRFWYVGITNDPDRRRSEHQSDGKDVQQWRFWTADSEADARHIELYLLERGLKGGASGGTNPTYVYIF